MNNTTEGRGFWRARFCVRRPSRWQRLEDWLEHWQPVPGDGSACFLRCPCALEFGEDE